MLSKIAEDIDELDEINGNKDNEFNNDNFSCSSPIGESDIFFIGCPYYFNQFT